MIVQSALSFTFKRCLPLRKFSRNYYQKRFCRILSEKSSRTVPNVIAIGSCRRNFCVNNCLLNSQRIFELTTSPFGEIVISSGDMVETKVLPIDPQKYPLQNKVFVKVERTGEGGVGSEMVEVSQEGATVQLTLNRGESRGERIYCTARLPIKYDIDANIKGSSSLSIENFENEHISIHSESGTCRMKNIRTGIVDIETRTGSIVCEGVLQGNASLKIIDEGDIKVHRIQGLTFKAEANVGDIEAKAVYADISEFSTHSGDIKLGSCHRQSSIQITETGDVNIGSLDGDAVVELAEGDVAINYVAKHENLSVQTEIGDIAIKLSDKLKTYVNLEGSTVNVAEDFDAILEQKEKSHSDIKHINGIIVGSGFEEVNDSDLVEAVSRSLVAQTGNGHINIKSADWISSLNLMANID